MNKYQIDEAPIRLREYGRNIQQMVDRLADEPDREKRSALAAQVVRVMATVTPVGNEPGAEAKLWEHLYRLSGYSLDIDAPFPLVKPEDREKPDRIPYYMHHSRFKQYGHNLQMMIRHAANMEDGEPNELYIMHLAKIMKQFQANYDPHKQASDNVVCEHLRILSDDKIKLNPEEVNLSLNVFGSRDTFNELDAAFRKKKRKVKKRRKKTGKNRSRF